MTETATGSAQDGERALRLDRDHVFHHDESLAAVEKEINA